MPYDGRSQQIDSENTSLSKTLTWLLRHGALKEGLPLQPNGYVPVNAILRHHRFRNKWTLYEIKQIVETDSKNRFTLRTNPQSGDYEICANQGHSIRLVEAALSMKRIDDPAEIDVAVHGTYHRHWASIKANGLRRQNRNHVHFAATDKQANNVSGFRSDCELLIYLDVRKAMLEGGMQLYRSANNVILCAGINDGCIPTKYFARVVERKTGQQVQFDKV